MLRRTLALLFLSVSISAHADAPRTFSEAKKVAWKQVVSLAAVQTRLSAL
jgi:hypothetical protein